MIEEVDGETEIIIETGIWVFKRKTTYRTNGNIVTDFFNWVKLPNKTVVPDSLSYQLDSWKKTGI